MADPSQLTIHDVFNQSPFYEDVDLFGSDQPLQDAVRRNGVDETLSTRSVVGRR